MIIPNASLSNSFNRFAFTVPVGQCGGRPYIRGMRIQVTDILEMLAENVSIGEILEDFPDLELADIQACLVFVKSMQRFLSGKMIADIFFRLFDL